MLNRQQHDVYLKQILRKIGRNDELNNQLILKGGTCLYLFYDLPRFSVDLDFNLKLNSSFNPQILTEVLEKELTIDDRREKHFTWFWLGSYQKGSQKIKIEVSKRNFPDEYEIKSFYGLSINTLAPAYLFAHKLCAIEDRDRLQNRDLYDAHFMFEKNFDINEDIITLRMNKTLVEYLDDLLVFIKDEVNSSTILSGLGELLNESQKNWVKHHLLSELPFQIQLRKEVEEKK